MSCRHCKANLSLVLVDLGSAPPSNAYLTELTMRRPEKWFPLQVLVCESCWLVQAKAYSRASELFNEEYAYFSSFSDIWLKHAEQYVADMVSRFGLTADKYVVEIAANDGYLLQYVMARGIPCCGVEPTASTAAAAKIKGIPIIEEFFGVNLAKKMVTQGKQADLITAINVPDINDFVSGFATLLKPSGVATFEFPHLLNLVQENQFDTIYHEHFSYLSFTTVNRICAANGLIVFDVEELQTHGGSLRVYAQRSDTGQQAMSARVDELIKREARAGMFNADFYAGFQAKAEIVKNDFLGFLLDAKRQGKIVAAYGAAAKGNTLMNYAGVRPDLIKFVVDRNPAKQGKYMPGSRIPIVDETWLKAARPDYVMLLPWNLKAEIMGQLSYVREWGGKFVVAVPKLEILDGSVA
jgi:hypothetical protein